jgi:hypothetical protein
LLLWHSSGRPATAVAALLGCQLVCSAQQLAVVVCVERPAYVVCLVSQMKRKVLKYNNALDDYLLLNS